MDRPRDGGRRRVVLAIRDLEIGGAEGQMVELAIGLKRRGWDVRVAALFGSGPHADRLEREHVEVYRAGFVDPRRGSPRQRVAGIVSLPVGFARYVAWLHRVQPDVVHAFLYHAYVTSAFAARLARVPTMIAGRLSLGTFKRDRRFALLVERGANACTDIVVANARAVAVDTRAGERLPADKVVVIPNGVPDRFFDIPELRRVSGVPRILCVANLRPPKGHLDLVEAAALLASDGASFVLVLAGDGPDRDAIERRAQELNAPIEILGRRRDIESLLADAEIVVSASHAEGFSNSLIEAMAAGRPVVATEVGGTAEALGDAGVLVPPRDPKAMSTALGTLLADEAARRDLACRARERVRAHFSLNRMIDAHVELYTRLARS